MGLAGSDELSERLARVARATAHAVVLCDRDGFIDWVNDSFIRMTGYTLDEAKGQRPGALLQCEESDPDTVAMMSIAIRDRMGFRAEVLNQAKDGRRFWVDLDVRPTTDETGAFDGFSAIQAEVTPSRELQAQHKANSIALRQAGKLARLGGWRVDLRDGLVHWSNELRELLGRTATEPHNPSLELYAEEDRPRVLDHLLHAIRTGERIDFEATAIDAAGRRIYLRVMGEAEMVDGRCVALHGASQDVTAQRDAMLELRESERFGRGVIDGFAGMLAVIDETGAMVEANARFRKRGTEIVGREYQPAGRNMFTVLSGLPRGYGRILERGLRDVLEGRTDSYSRAYTARDGEWYRLTASRFAGEGPVRCVVATQSIADIKRSEKRLREMNLSLRKARDDANAASLAKSAFLATMSHEIRTPLNGVLGMAQAMARDELPYKQRERLSVIRQAGETLLVLLNDLLDLSRIEAGRLELEDGLVDIGQIARGAHATFTTLASEKDLTFDLDVDEAAMGTWRGDPTRVRQILYNLVSNAVKFTARGDVSVEVTRNDGDLVLKVSDTGPGIAADRLPVLFDKFVQEDASTTRRYGGSGLGLAICRELASLMGGAIAVESEVGVGSTFTVRLPLAPAEGVVAEELISPVEVTEASREARILAAEDNPMNQLVLRTLLAQMGIEVVCVSDGAQAVAAYADQEWDAILMDVQMPIMDGPTATRLIREQERAQGRRRIPIIALTANAMAHHEAEYLAAGMDDLVPKPLELERLLSAIQGALETAKAA